MSISFCSICAAAVRKQPLYCSQCSSLGFAPEPICSPKCLKRASIDHEVLHRARPHPPAGISPVWRLSCGRCLVATKNFDPGDVVLCESPILHGSWTECNIQFQSLSEEEQDCVLSFSAADDEELIEDADRLARKRIDPSEFADQTSELVQILFNNSIDMANDEGGLFAYGSLIAHCCKPNVDGMFQESKWVVRALLPIRKGDILGWNYNLSPNILMEGTARRQAEMLELRGFICSCSLCQDVDYLRSFPCPSCQKGVLVGVYQHVLACDSCGAGISDAELATCENIERTLYLEMKESHWVDWSSLADRAWSQLGPYHGVTGRACFEAVKYLQNSQLPSRTDIVERLRLFLSSSTMKNAVTVHQHIQEYLPRQSIISKCLR